MEEFTTGKPTIRRDESLLQGVLSAIPEPFFVYDEDGTYLDVLGGMDRSKYHDAKHLIGRTMHDVMNRKLADFLLAKIRTAVETGRVTTCEYSIDPKEVSGYDGTPGPTSRRWFEAHISPVPATGSEKRTVVWIAFDITDLKLALNKLDRQRRRLRDIARKDALTGLNNRRSFFEKSLNILQNARKKHTPVWALMMDLDHFKSVNDRLGHHVGDFCLKTFSALIAKNIKKTDALGRLGGEEFAIVLSADSARDVTALAERIRKETENQKIVFNETEIFITVSIGISRVGERENDIIEVLKRADSAMYRAKANGRNQVVLAE